MTTPTDPIDDEGRLDPEELRRAMRRLSTALNRAIIAQANLLSLQLEPLARNLEALMEALTPDAEEPTP